VASILVGELKLTDGGAPHVNDSFKLLVLGDVKAYGVILKTMFFQIGRNDDSRA
jgi:hypothetical protein